MKMMRLLRHLRQNNCRVMTIGGKNSVYINMMNDRTASVPRYKDISNRLAQLVCEDLEIPPLDISSSQEQVRLKVPPT